MKHLVYTHVLRIFRNVLCGLGFLGSLGVTATSVKAQNVECIDLVRSIYRRMTRLESNKTCHMEYSVRSESVMRGRKYTSVSNVRVTANDRQLSLISDQMEVHQDASTAVFIIPAKKLIQINVSNLSAFRAKKGQSIAMLQDSLFSFSDLMDCGMVEDKESLSDRQATFQIHQNLRSRLQMETFTVFMDSKAKLIRRVKVTPPAGGTLVSIDVRFKDIDYDARVEIGSALNAVFDTDGKILPKYKGFKLLDNRNLVR